MENKKTKLIKWQLPMKRVLYALIPIIIFSIYLYGLKILILLIVVGISGFVSEFLFTKPKNKPVTSAVFVSIILYTLTLPPTIPYWIAAIGIIFGIIFGKMVFGGFGKNVFNPAIVGRAFIYINFGTFMTKYWVDPFTRFPGGFTKYFTDAITSATPIHEIAEGMISLKTVFLGLTSGSTGETSALLILIGGIYIIYKKAANWKIVVSGILSFTILQSIFWYFKIPEAVDPLSAMMTGGFMLGMFFMATDPVSASQTDTGRWIYGSLIGVLTVLIRLFAIWHEGMMFAILLGNMFAPIIDYYIKERKKVKKIQGVQNA